MTLRAIGEITGLWALVGTSFADVDMAWIAGFLAAAWTVKLFGVWLYGLIWRRPGK